MRDLASIPRCVHGSLWNSCNACGYEEKRMPRATFTQMSTLVGALFEVSDDEADALANRLLAIKRPTINAVRALLLDELPTRRDVKRSPSSLASELLKALS